MIKIERLNYRFLILLSTVLACAILAFFVGFIREETIVYTHFFYIPILLAGVWYRKKAVYIALLLSSVYILVALLSPQTALSAHIFERSAIFVAVAYVIGFVSEERAKGEEKLKETKEEIKNERDKLNLILESMDDGVCIISKDYEVEFMNRVLIDAFGYHVGDICYKAFHNRDEPCPGCKNPEVVKGKTVRWEWHSRRTNRTYDLFEAPLKNIDGTISKLTIFRDITDRKRMEDNLRDAEERYRVIFEHALTALCVIEHGKFISLANKEFEALSGYSREEIKGKKWIDFATEEDRDRVQNYCEERRKGEAPACCEFRFVSRDGEIKHVNAWIEPIPGTDSCIASLLDMTDLKRKEEELRETCKRLAELDKMKSDFLNVAYHELRSPLAPIVGYASMLERYKLPDRGMRYLRAIEQSAKQLEKLINRMLELARIDGKKIGLSLEWVRIPEVVSEVVKSLEPEAKEKRQKISMSIPEIEVQADKQKLIAIFTNLVSNAIKYTPEGGKIDINVEDRGEGIRACVADTGIGIPEEHLPKIFERFYMVDTSLTRKSGSLGLGLSIVKEYVKLHGGIVWARSEVGKGSEFFFTIPKRRKAIKKGA